MRADRKGSIAAIAVVIAMMQVALPPEMRANTSRSMAPRWSVQVNKVDAGNVHIDQGRGRDLLVAEQGSRRTFSNLRWLSTGRFPCRRWETAPANIR